MLSNSFEYGNNIYPITMQHRADLGYKHAFAGSPVSHKSTLVGKKRMRRKIKNRIARQSRRYYSPF